MNIHCIETFFTVHDFWATCASLKKQLPWKFSLYWIYFLPFRIFEQLALALKKRVAINSPYWIYFLPFRIFEQLALAVKNRVCLEIFHCIEYTFYIQDFWSTCDCPEKQSVPWNFSRATCDCPENRVALEFFNVFKYFLSFRIFEQLALALKTEFALKFFNPGVGGLPPPDTPSRTPMSLDIITTAKIQ